MSAIRLAPGLILFALAACSGGSEQPAKPSAGQQARAKVDAATQAFGKCVLDKARSQPADAALGPLAQRAVEACPDQRAALKQEVVAFSRIGRPSLNDYQAGLLAEASVKQLETGLREQAALAIVNRPGFQPKS